MAANSTARSAFVNALRDFCVTNGYDGADIDWEYPAASDKAAVSLLFTELRQAFSSVQPPLTLSIAAPSTDWQGGYDWAVMNQVLDWVGVMTYDFYGSWTPKAGPNSPLYGNSSLTDQGWIDNSVNYYRGKGIPSAKLLIGIPFYGWQFNATSMYGVSTGASQLPYVSIAPLLLQGWTRSWDSTTKVPHIINADKTRVISYDDTVSIAEKTSYIKSQQLAGAIIWALGQDFLGGEQPVVGVAQSFSASTPEACVLYQNFPNPFNGQTHIRYQLSRSGHYTLKLFDVLGREWVTLASREYQPGLHEVSVSSDALPSGVYVYRLSGEGLILSRTLIVLR
jgi:chitinase